MRLLAQVKAWGWPIEGLRVLQRKVAQLKNDAEKLRRCEQVGRSGRDGHEQSEYEQLLEELLKLMDDPEVRYSPTASFLSDNTDHIEQAPSLSKKDGEEKKLKAQMGDRIRLAAVQHLKRGADDGCGNGAVEPDSSSAAGGSKTKSLSSTKKRRNMQTYVL